jgi:hypothetical protein
VVAGVVVLALLAGVGVIVYLSGRAKGGNGNHDGGTTTASSAQPQASQSAAPLDPKLVGALNAVGYACFESITQPVVVHSCYGDPGNAVDERTVRIHSDPAGKIIGVLVDIGYYEDAAAARTEFDKTVQALTKGFLPAADVETIMTSMVKGKEIEKPYSGGSLSLFANDKGLTYVLELVPTGGRLRSIPFGTTNISLKDLSDEYTPRGFQCSIDPKLKVMKCSRREEKAYYQIYGFDPCIDHEANFEELCKGSKGVKQVVVSVGFANGMSRQAYEPIFKFLVEGARWASGGWSPEANAWVMKNSGDAKVHRGDFQQLHIELKPGGGASGGFPSSFQISVGGLVLTPST